MKLAKNGERTKGITAYANGLDSRYLNDVDRKCVINKPYFLENWRENFSKKESKFFSYDDAGYRRRRLGYQKLLNKIKKRNSKKN